VDITSKTYWIKATSLVAQLNITFHFTHVIKFIVKYSATQGRGLDEPRPGRIYNVQVWAWFNDVTTGFLRKFFFAKKK
jgi:hypothetical protein